MQLAVEEIWHHFDKDKNGRLDYEETAAFIRHTLVEMGESPDYNEIDFLQCFKQFRKGEDGYIHKHEMMTFIKKVAGLKTEDNENCVN